GAGGGAVDTGVGGDAGALGAVLVRRPHVADQRLDEGGLVEMEERVARAPGGLRRRGRGRLLRRCRFRQCDGGGGGRGTADDGALQEIAPAKALILHGILPGSGLSCRRMRSPSNCAFPAGAAIPFRAGKSTAPPPCERSAVASVRDLAPVPPQLTALRQRRRRDRRAGVKPACRTGWTTTARCRPRAGAIEPAAQVCAADCLSFSPADRRVIR